MSGSHYPGKEVKIVKSFQGNPSLDNYSLDDVVAGVQSLPRYGDHIAVHENHLIETDAYTGLHNHFQGIQRLRQGQYFVFSGGNIKDSHAHLFLVKLSFYLHEWKDNYRVPYRIQRGAVGSNILIKEKIPGVDQLEDIICLETGRYWHAGGIAMSGDILAVPLENRDEEKSMIAFYNFKNVKKIQRLNNMIVRPDAKCGAVALAQLKSGKLICVSWSDDDSAQDRFEIYISRTKKNPFLFNPPITINYSKAKNKPSGKSKFQAIQLVQQTDGKLYIIATQNTNMLAPKLKGTNELLLFELNLKKTSKRRKQSASIKFILKRRFASGGSYYNFAAACGIYVNRDKKISLYSGHHWRNEKSIRFAEFYDERIDRKQKLQDVDESRIELFEDKNYKKRKLLIYGKRFSKLKKYDDVYIHGGYFDDKITSIRYLLPEGVRYRLYDDSDFNKGNKRKNYLTLTGTGYPESIPDLSKMGYDGLKFKRNFNDRISSSKFL